MNLRLLYSACVFAVTFYASMIPIVLVTGWWAQTLYRPGDWFGQTPHLVLILVAWTLLATRKSATWMAIAATTASFLYSQLLSNWSLFRDHDGRLWFAMIMILLAEPVLAVLLIRNANRIAPILIRKWDPSYAQ